MMEEWAVPPQAQRERIGSRKGMMSNVAADKIASRIER